MSEQVKTVTLILQSSSGEDKIEVPAALWKKFKKLAKAREQPVEELFLVAVDSFLKRKAP
jgi:hypothetical protein